MGDDFGSTQWSLVLAARESSRAALEALCAAYYQPVHRYVLGQLRDSDAAQDATQEFFTRQFVTGAVLRSADPAQGRFRAWLLASVKHHLSNLRDHQRTAKSGGGVPNLPLEAAAGAGEPAEAEYQFERAWGLTVLSRARDRLAELYRGNPELFEVLQRFLPGDDASLSEAAAQLGKTHGAVKTAVSRFRDDFGDAARFEIAQTVSTPAEVDAEIRALIVAVSRNPKT